MSWNPQFLAVPRTAATQRGELITDAPAGIAAVDDVHETLLVALIGIIVAREEIAVFGECERLRIAQAHREELEMRAVGVATEHGAVVERDNFAAFPGFHMCAAVADAVIEFPVGSPNCAMHVVAHVIETHAVTAT